MLGNIKEKNMLKAKLHLPYACREGINSSRGTAPLHHGTSHAEQWLASGPGRFTSKKRSPMSTRQEIGRDPKHVWTFLSKKYVTSAGNRNPENRDIIPGTCTISRLHKLRQT
jgi:hypothetical protein